MSFLHIAVISSFSFLLDNLLDVIAIIILATVLINAVLIEFLDIIGQLNLDPATLLLTDQLN